MKDRVRENTATLVNQQIDREITGSVLGEADPEARVQELEREWSVERVLEAESALVALLGLALGTAVHPAMLAQTGLAAGMVWLHGVQGWYPLLPLFRRLGLRTRSEIDREKFGLLARSVTTAEDVLSRELYPDRVRRHTDRATLERLDRESESRVRELRASGRHAIRARLDELAKEWDVERVLQVNASTLALTGLALGVARDRRWLLVPGFVFSFFFQHAVQGWCPPIPVLRRLGIRTRQEIDREHYALLAALDEPESAV